jgi:3-oxoacyl-(acyl-carrier-protein) synthase
MKPNISSLGCICSLGSTIAEISKNLFTQDIKPSFITDRFNTSLVGYPVFQLPQDILNQKNPNQTLTFFFLQKALDEALENAHLSKQDLSKARVGVCIGTSVDASFKCFDFYKSWRKNENPSLDPLEKYIDYSISQEVLNKLQLKGISQTIVTACASGTDAIGIGSTWIENDFCDIVIAGGADELNLIPYTGFIKLMVASKDHCKPFDKNRNGINLGEGAGVVILESNNFAKKRNAPKVGTLKAYASACDGYHLTSPHPQGRGLKKALTDALESAGILSSKIAFINAHATASIDNDAAEAKVFNEILKGVPVVATKSLTGHCLGGAGAIEACLTLISLNQRQIPKTKNFQTYDDNIGFLPTLENTPITSKKIAISDSLSFGGCNSVLILEGENYE